MNNSSKKKPPYEDRALKAAMQYFGKILLPLLGIKEKAKSGESIGKEDIVSLLLTPLMSGRITVKERIEEAIKMLRKQPQLFNNRDEQQAMEAILYVFASKLLNNDELNQISEVIKMTPLGEILFEDGRKEGRKEALLEAIADVLGQREKIPQPVTERIQAQDDLAVLKEWFRIALKSDSISEFQSKI